MTTSISTLHPPADPRPTALALRLNPEVLQQLRSLHKAHATPKLVVKDGKFSVKISDTLIFPCSVSPETLRLDIYSPASAEGNLLDYNFTGTVASRLNVMSDSKQIKENSRVSVFEMPVLPPPAKEPRHVSPPLEEIHEARPSSADSRAYVFSGADSDAERALKFISYIALGPMTRSSVEEKLHLTTLLRSSDTDQLFASHTQPFLRKDTFTEGDVYPLLSSGQQAEITPSQQYVILKDKAYKELRPWQWHAYTDFERQLILVNCNNALSRLGFSETHPLRLRIVDRSSPQRSTKKSTNLGGGLLVSSAKRSHQTSGSSHNETHSPGPGSPANTTTGRAVTESPNLHSETRKRFADRGRKAIGSPLRQDDSAMQGHVTNLVLSSSSDDEKVSKKISGQTRTKRLSNSSSQSNSSVNSNTNSYTSPSSVNEDAHSDPSDQESKPLGTIKQAAAASLPSRPSSSITNLEKKQQYYSQLAEKFRSRYHEYERLHRQLAKDSRKNSNSEKKKSLMKLFELHNTLSEWKRRLWDFHNENNMAEGVMNLSKHRKSNSMSKISASAPSTTRLSSAEKFAGSSGGQTVRKQPFSERSGPNRAKITMDY